MPPPRYNDPMLGMMREITDQRTLLRKISSNVPLFDLSSQNTPAQITSNQNNYAIGDYDVLRISSNAARTVTGLAEGLRGRFLFLFNVGAFTITLSHQSASSLAANRFKFSAAADYSLTAGAAVAIYYDDVQARWIDAGGGTASGSSGEPGAGYMVNGKLSVTVAGNNLTVAIKTLGGLDPSVADPIIVRIGDTLHTISAALSVTANAATNWCNSGSAELATQEVDYFVYLGYNATDGVVIGFSRLAGGTRYDSFSTTSTNQKFCKISTITNAAAGDYYEVIGRFAATLSAGAGYTWTVPTFTAINLINRPIYESRWLTWLPVYSASGGMTYTSVSGSARYKTKKDTYTFRLRVSGTTGGTASATLTATAPWIWLGASVCVLSGYTTDGGAAMAAFAFASAGTPDTINQRKSDSSNYGLGASRTMNIWSELEI